ncbi:winged helix-turn-helix domain-containing protein [Sinorhizobium prairiense]|uniref:winged helix-turn-helix domain-containing protein n=1 Tax=unclassified Sinorhizobium TaxID=2613772 RepID=UPI0023D87D15|nr:MULTISPECIES: winged helix-turn-helix domain-containing protein [unclassified Sinorhizobium]WEJ09949.1 winged helix-turn-helix domain-containing protein [Sinorhizobium sp. M103]WEJ15501.1 winged helix-turn-helix domain-containing protein [Sinorhizobium sp. K101]WEJ36912.1 winged helix-turn-helix domain-containing protein [Sinorhizobium sp. C101]
MIPDYQALMLPVLRLASEGETRVADVAERIADDLGLTPEEREELLPSGRQRLLHNRIHWAKFYMSKAGLIASPARGRFLATDKGKALLATAPERIDVALLMREPEFRNFYRNEGCDGGEESTTTRPDRAAPSAVTCSLAAISSSLRAATARR